MISDSGRPAIFLETSKGVTLLGASPASTADIEESLTRAPVLVAADGGATRAIELGQMPRAVMGDLDSLDGSIRAQLDQRIICEISEQETTDFEKCLDRIAAPFILATGFTGARLDHELAVYNALARRRDRRCVVIGDRDIAFVAPERLEMDVPLGTRVSLFPMSPVEAVSEGLEWPIAGLDLRPDGRVGTSNRATGRVKIDIAAGMLLVILPKAMLGQALAGLVPGQDAGLSG